ncbi:chromosome partitioning protein ParB [Paraburkholderia sp. Ac-20340]|uniref:ParB/RepB/Spo0J family partition protein n=1 Tax=Paraburkholderia sp. Ac-20340 TaxID=2703888 RepID=UPI00197DA91C|nr:chromosome partitioning protein ParB [Paraburkholderia sp. Ac-20340]MBN3856755.1 chromosome partitioning protein ParB [Paraburkholderia sp. Ac-20340]
MSIGKRLAQRTAGIELKETTAPAPSQGGPALTSPGRLMSATSRIVEAEDRALAAERTAEAVKVELEDARRQIESLQQSNLSAGTTEIEISTLVEVPGRRRVLSPVEYSELRENLQRNPLVHPIVFRPLGDGKNEIVSGNNRVAIYRDELGRTTILGVPFTGDAKSAEMGATFSNLLAPSLPDFEKFRQFVRLQEESGFTRSEIIEASGLTKQHVSRILSFEKLPQEARDAIARRPDRVGGNAAEDFAALATDGNAEAVVKAIRALVTDESLTQKRALELAKPKREKVAAAPLTRTITIGRKKLCDISVRSGVIGLRFAGSADDAEATAQMWADRIETLIRREVEEKNAEEGR